MHHALVATTNLVLQDDVITVGWRLSRRPGAKVDCARGNLLLAIFGGPAAG